MLPNEITYVNYQFVPKNQAVWRYVTNY